ncbi:MAG TPA: hypothetical protein VF581_07080 [Flavobacterium sp.]|jgi:phage-related protein
MESQYNNNDQFQADNDFDNIIRINNYDESEDLQDFDFDYDPNEMYYALNNEKN